MWSALRLVVALLLVQASGFVVPRRWAWGSQGLGVALRSLREDGEAAVGPWSRRDVLAGVGSVAATSVPGRAAAGPNLPRAQEGLLVWRSKENATTCGPGRVNGAFGPRFINYLARFLLAYDGPSRRLWRSRSEEIPLSWSSAQVIEKRRKQLGEFVASVESGLCAYLPPGDDAVDWSLPEARSKTRQLFSLLRSRYGDRPDAKRQIALLFCLLPPAAQPTRSIVELVARDEDRDVSQILVLDGGSVVSSREGDAPSLDAPDLPRPAAGSNMSAAAAAPKLRATGAVGRIVVTFPAGAGRGRLHFNVPLQESLRAITQRVRRPIEPRRELLEER